MLIAAIRPGRRQGALLVLLAAILALATAELGRLQAQTATTGAMFRADLGVDGSAGGSGEVVLRQTASGSLEYSLIIPDASGSADAHIHLGATGETGDLIATLATDASAGTNGSIRSSGTIADGSLPVTLTFDALLTAMAEGAAYVDVHFDGAAEATLRGQLRAAGNASLNVPLDALDAPSGVIAVSGNVYLLTEAEQSDGITRVDVNGESQVQIDLDASASAGLDAAATVENGIVTMVHWDTTASEWVPLATVRVGNEFQANAEASGSFRLAVYPAKTVSITSGWSTMAFTGGNGTVVTNLAATLGSSVESIWRFDAEAQAWAGWRASVPASINTLAELNQGDTLFIRATGSGSAEILGAIPGDNPQAQIALQVGDNFVTYQGAAGAASTIFAGMPSVEAVFAWDAQAQTWTVYRPELPTGLNSLTEVETESRLFVRTDAASVWTYTKATGSASGG